jgi:hypothetical protein
MRKLFEELEEIEDEEEEQDEFNVPVEFGGKQLNNPPVRSVGVSEDFNLGGSVEWRKAKYKWSMSDRMLNAIVSRLNRDYHVWKGNIKWYQERTGRWNLYVVNISGMDRFIRQIEHDLEALPF